MIRLATPSDIDSIIDLHSAVLDWSINGRLGRSHIARLYEALFAGDDFFVVVMRRDDTGELLGFASATIDAPAARRRIQRAVGWSGRLRLLAAVLRKPGELIDLLETALVVPVLIGRTGIHAEILTWVAQRNSAAGALAGSRCFGGVLSQLAERGHSRCVAQVLKSNVGPNRFHAARRTHRAHSLIANNIYVIESSSD